MKTVNKLKDLDGILDAKYGAPGTEQRAKAESDAMEYYSGIQPDTESGEVPTLYVEEQRIFEPEKVWFTSDTHFWHKNILRFCNRPFGSIEEMNENLIRNWNETVPADGFVFHLGDFSFGGSKEWNDILSRLNGKIYLILGNHDMKQMKRGFMKRFEHVTQQMTIRVGGQPVILNHNPFLTYGGCYRNTWQLFGHVHSGPLSDQGKDLTRLQVLFPRQYDVGVDNNDYRPVSFMRVKEKIEARVAASQHSRDWKDFIGTWQGD